MSGITALWALYLIAAWTIVTGIFEIAAAIRLRKQITNEWLLILGGVALVLFGLLIAVMLGAEVSLTVNRDGREEQLRATLGEPNTRGGWAADAALRQDCEATRLNDETVKLYERT